jgi:phytoene dehydrogenase-like protein
VARIIVVGAGMAGLAAAARLAGRDNSVLVCEASPVAGGTLGSWRHDDPAFDGDPVFDSDLSFDIGAHTLTLPAAYRDLFIKTGSRKKSAAAALEDHVDLRPLDPVRRYVFPDGTRLDLPNASRGRLRAAFDEALGGGAGDAWLRVIDHGSRAWDAIRPTLVESPGGGRELARLLRTAEGRRALTPLRSLRALAGQWFKHADPRLFLVLDDYARQGGADPQRAPGVLAARPYVEHAFGAWRIVGGMHTLAEALRRRVLDRGAEIRHGARVAQVEISASGAVSSVLLEGGERLAADVVIAAVDRAVLARLVGGPVPKGPYSPSVTTLCLVCEDPPDMPHETVLLDGRGPAVRIHVAAEQPTAWTVHAPGEREPETVLADLAARGFDVRDKVRVQHTITAADREAATGVPGGAAYGPAANSLRAALLRSPIAQPTPGLFHVGASARPGAGLSFAALSGWQAAELIKGQSK